MTIIPKRVFTLHSLTTKLWHVITADGRLVIFGKEFGPLIQKIGNQCQFHVLVNVFYLTKKLLLYVCNTIII